EAKGFVSSRGEQISIPEPGPSIPGMKSGLGPLLTSPGKNHRFLIVRGSVKKVSNPSGERSGVTKFELPLTPMAATGIGSVPFTDAEEAVSLILEAMPRMPYWPQMVRLGFREEMTAQAARGLAALKIDEAARNVQVDPDLPRDQALAEFYEAVLAGELTPFALEEEEARGFFALLRAAAAGELPCQTLK